MVGRIANKSGELQRAAVLDQAHGRLLVELEPPGFDLKRGLRGGPGLADAFNSSVDCLKKVDAFATGQYSQRS